MNAATAHDKRALALLLLAALVVLGAGMGLRDPWPSDEPRYVLVAQQMVASGDWLFPRRGSELYSDKPPMLMWLQALGFQITGQWRVAFLLPSLLAGLGTLVLVWDVGRRLFTPRAGLLAAIAVLSALMFSFQFKRAQIDPLVTFLITLANWGLLRHLLQGPNWKMYWLGCFAAGLGVITKGVGVIALFMLLPYALARRQGWQGLAITQGAAWRWAGGGLAFLAAISLWLVPMALVALQRGTPEYLGYLQDILFNQTARRYAGQVGGHAAKPWWYFFPVLLVHFFPLSLAYVHGWRDWRAAWQLRDARYALLGGWCLLVFIFFTLAIGKREVYVLPMLPMLALALAPTLERLVDARWLRTTALGIVVLAGIGLLAAGWWVGQGHAAKLNAVMLERGLDGELRALSWSVAAIGAAWLVVAATFRVQRGVHALLAALAVLWITWGLALAPQANASVSSAAVMRQVDRVAGPGEVAMVAWKEQNLLMSPRPLKDFGFRTSTAEQFERAVAWLQAAPAQRWIFANQQEVQACVDRSKVTVVGSSNRREWSMFQVEAVKPGCQLPRVEAGAKANDAED